MLPCKYRGALGGTELAIYSLHKERVETMEMLNLLLLLVMGCVAVCALIHAERSAKEAQRARVQVLVQTEEQRPRR